MTEPALDLSEIVGMYKEDGRRMVREMRAALLRWDEISIGGPARTSLRRLAHQFRGSGRTYGFRDVTRVGKAMEQIMWKMEKQTLAASDAVRHSLASKVDRLETIFTK